MSSRAQWYADRLRELLARHNATPAEVERRTAGSGQPPVAAFTVRRILQAKVRHEPDRRTLERIAHAFAEDPRTTFPTFVDPAAGIVAKTNAVIELTMPVKELLPSPETRRLITALVSATARALEAVDAGDVESVEKMSKSLERLAGGKRDVLDPDVASRVVLSVRAPLSNR